MNKKYLHPQILFVDDEQNILDGLKRSLFQFRKEWEMYFATSGAAALEIIENKEINIVVTDIRMPIMNGVELLFKIREKHPEIIRIILSGQSDENLLLDATLVAHQFLSKPSNTEILVETIKELFYLRSNLRDDTILKIVNGIMKLSPTNQHFAEIDQEINSNNISMNKIASYVAKDVNLSAKILHVVNSAFFGLSNRIANIEMALNFLGVNTIKAIMYLLRTQESFDGLDIDQNLISTLFEHSVKVAKAAELIYTTEHKNSQEAKEAYTIGLLHDVGKLALCYIPKYKEEVMRQKNFLSVDNEFELLGVSHSEVGAYLLSIWNLPQTVTEAIAFHHNRKHFTDIGFNTIIYFANYLVKKENDYQLDFTPELNNKIKQWAMLIQNQ